MKSTVKWVLIANRNFFGIFSKRHHSEAQQVKAVDNMDAHHLHLTNELGRGVSSAGTVRHAYEPHTNWKEVEKENFSRVIAECLYKANLAKEFDELYVIAEPKLLGEIRKHLHREVTAKLEKDFAHSVSDIDSMTIHQVNDLIEKLLP